MPRSIRTAAKRLAEIALCRVGLAAWRRRQLQNGTVIFAYHNIVPTGEQARGDISLHLRQRTFGQELDLLRRTHDIIPLHAALERPARGLRPRAVVTLDDATSGALSAGVEELVARGLTATFFVAPAYVPGGAFWWDALENLTDARREHALTSLSGAELPILEWARTQGIRLLDVPAHQRCGTEEQLAAAEREGMSLGVHTWSHRNLAVLTAEEIEAELSRPLVWLRERFASVVPWLAYPFGRFSALAAGLAAELGYMAALRVDGGWIDVGQVGTEARFRLPRVNVPAGLSLEGFRLRSAGMFTR